MKSKMIYEHGGEKTYVLIFETGDTVSALILEFARREKLAAAHFTAIGALRDVTLGYYEWDKKEYKHIPLHEQVEVLSLIGDIALDESEKPTLHAHIVVGRADGSTRGGHLVEAQVRPTLEVVLVASPAHLQRRHDSQSGLALIRL